MEKQKQAYIYAMVTVLMWATVASAFKISLRYLDFLELLLFASFASLIVFLVILAIQRKLVLLTSYSGRDFLRSALLGAINPFLYYIVLFKAYSLLPAQEAMVLNYVWPITLVVLSIPLLGQRIGARSILAVVVGFLGIVIIATHGNVRALQFAQPAGVLLALGSTILWALFWIYNVKDKRDEVAKLFLNFAFGFAFVLTAVLLSGRAILPSAAGLLGAAYVGCFEMGITFVVWLKALTLSRTTAQVGNFIYVIPFLSLIVIRLVIGEQILPSTVIGLVLVVLGIVLQRYGTAGAG